MKWATLSRLDSSLTHSLIHSYGMVCQDNAVSTVIE